MQAPPPLQPGDSILVVAPSGPAPMGAFWSGVAWLRERYRVRLTPDVLSRKGYLAGDDSRRQGELAAAFADGDAKAIVAARGGYGATRILRDLPWADLMAHPKWIVGFSDITALHVEAWARGLPTIHGANVTGLGHLADGRTRATWLRSLEVRGAEYRWSGLGVIREGEGVGVLVGGNLTLLATMAAAGRLTIPRGAVLVLEDVGERPYRIDRAITSLEDGGYLRGLSAVVLGEFTDCGPNADGVSAMDALGDRLGALGIPVLHGAPFGHGARNDAFVLGERVEVAGDAVRFIHR